MFNRLIPVLTINNGRLVKTLKFSRPQYLGDPVNAIRIFNDKEVDEVVVLDIRAGKEQTGLPFELLTEMAGECFMPLAYGGGVRNIDQVKQLFQCGIEKVVVNAHYGITNGVFEQGAAQFGSQSMVAALDVHKGWLGNTKAYCQSGTTRIKSTLTDLLKSIENAGAGEILVNNIDRDGTFEGLDIDLTQMIASQVGIPVVTSGGLNSLANLREAIEKGKASAVAAGAFFSYKNNDRKSILINYPDRKELDLEVFSKIHNTSV